MGSGVDNRDDWSEEPIKKEIGTEAHFLGVPVSELHMYASLPKEVREDFIKRGVEYHEFQEYCRLAKKFEGKDTVRFRKDETNDS